MTDGAQSVLACGPLHGVAPALQQALAAAGTLGVTAADAAAAVAELRLHPHQIVVVDLSFGDHDLEWLAATAAKSGALLVGAGGDVADAAERAMRLGCRELLRAGSTPDAIAARLHAVAARLGEVALRREDFLRLRHQNEEMRRFCTQQAERFHESQETFFLDLSRMMTIITNIMDGIVFVDRDGNVTLMNPAAEDLLGVKSFLAMGKPVAELSGSTELLGAITADLQRIRAQKESAQVIEVHHSQQDLLYIRLITSRVLDYRGQVAGSLVVMKDVTAEHKTDQLKNRYLSIVAHELRTPLTGIKTFSTMMSKGKLGELTERQMRVVESIREQSLRLEHQIDKLINLGQIESEDYGQDREVIPLSDLTTGLLAPFEMPARDRGIRIELQCTAEDVSLHCDRSDLRRACQAIVENAVKFTPDGGEVLVTIRGNAREGVRFCVRDTGIGIDPRYQRRIFEKFFQVEDPLTRHHGGAGLGLFVARGIVEAHGSRIEVSSKLGQGAEFSFALPLYADGHAETVAVAGTGASPAQT